MPRPRMGRGAAAWAAAVVAALLFQGAADAQSPVPRSLDTYPAQGPAFEARPDRLDPSGALRLSQGALGNALRAHVLRDADGASLRLADLRGKPLLVSFVYTGCFQVCPTTTRVLKRAVDAAMRTLGPDAFNVMSVGFNQPFDTPQALRAFAQQQGVHLPNWHFASPDPDTLAALAQDLGFTFAPAAGGFDHITQVTVVDAEGIVVAQVYGDDFALRELVEPLKGLLTGRRPERPTLAGLAERVRLLCTYYDPVSGEYRFRYAILIEVAGGITGLLALIAFMARTLRVPAARRPTARTP